MEYLLLALLIMSVFHFVYDGIIKPQRKLETEIKVLDLYDRLSSYKPKDQELYDIIHDGIGRNLESIQEVTIFHIMRGRSEIEIDIDRQEKVLNTIKMISTSKDSELQNFDFEYRCIFSEALKTNSFIWVVYTFPFFLLFKAYDLTVNHMASRLRMSSAELLIEGKEKPENTCKAYI